MSRAAQPDQPVGKARHEEREAEDRSAVRPNVVHKAISREGEEELKRSNAALFWSGLAAGLSMGFSFLAEALLKAHLPEAGWAPAVSKLGYSVGFVIVILGRQQLFTENTLTVMLPLMSRKDGRTLVNVLRLWGVVLIANLIGAAAFAAVARYTPAFSDATREAMLTIGRVTQAPDAATTLLRGIFAGWLIAIMIWMLPAAETARFWVIILITYVVALSHSAHIVAGATETLYVVFSGEAGFGSWLLTWCLPALAGNIIGGVMLVAAINHAQVVAHERE